MAPRDEPRPWPAIGLGDLKVDRRRFLTMSGAGAAILAFERPAAAAMQAVGASYPLSVGYVDGSDTLESLETMPWETSPDSQQSVPAADMGGDQSMALSPMLVRVVGLYPAWPWPGRYRPDAIDLDVDLATDAPGGSPAARYMAWSFRRKPAPDISAPVRFRMWTGVSEGLATRLRVVQRAPQERIYRTSFTVDWADGEPRLKRGIYLLGLDDGTWAEEAKIPGAGEPADYARRSLVVTVQPQVQPD